MEAWHGYHKETQQHIVSVQEGVHRHIYIYQQECHGDILDAIVSHRDDEAHPLQRAGAAALIGSVSFDPPRDVD